jgi:hypothetical protein
VVLQREVHGRENRPLSTAACVASGLGSGRLVLAANSEVPEVLVAEVGVGDFHRLTPLD